MAFDSNGILDLPISVAATIVITFIFFGSLLTTTGGTFFFTDAAMLTMGRFRVGSMKIAVVASALFGSISGSAVANVVGTGVITIPMIKRDGYPAHKAAAIEAVASTGGQLMPPVMGASAFLMAEFLSVPYSAYCVAAFVPAILYYVALFIQADLDAASSELPPAARVLLGMHFVRGENPGPGQPSNACDIGRGALMYRLFRRADRRAAHPTCPAPRRYFVSLSAGSSIAP